MKFEKSKNQNNNLHDTQPYQKITKNKLRMKSVSQDFKSQESPKNLKNKDDKAIFKSKLKREHNDRYNKNSEQLNSVKKENNPNNNKDEELGFLNTLNKLKTFEYDESSIQRGSLILNEFMTLPHERKVLKNDAIIDNFNTLSLNKLNLSNRTSDYTVYSFKLLNQSLDICEELKLNKKKISVDITSSDGYFRRRHNEEVRRLKNLKEKRENSMDNKEKEKHQTHKNKKKKVVEKQNSSKIKNEPEIIKVEENNELHNEKQEFKKTENDDIHDIIEKSIKENENILQNSEKKIMGISPNRKLSKDSPFSKNKQEKIPSEENILITSFSKHCKINLFKPEEEKLEKKDHNSQKHDIINYVSREMNDTNVHLFPVLEKNIQFHIESPIIIENKNNQPINNNQNNDYNIIYYDTNPSKDPRNEGENNFNLTKDIHSILLDNKANLKENNCLDNDLEEINLAQNFSINFSKNNSDNQQEKDMNNISNLNMINSYANNSDAFSKLKETKKIEELNNKLNYFSNDSMNFLKSVQENKNDNNLIEQCNLQFNDLSNIEVLGSTYESRFNLIKTPDENQSEIISPKIINKNISSNELIVDNQLEELRNIESITKVPIIPNSKKINKNTDSKLGFINKFLNKPVQNIVPKSEVVYDNNKDKKQSILTEEETLESSKSDSKVKHKLGMNKSDLNIDLNNRPELNEILSCNNKKSEALNSKPEFPVTLEIRPLNKSDLTERINHSDQTKGFNQILKLGSKISDEKIDNKNIKLSIKNPIQKTIQYKTKTQSTVATNIKNALKDKGINNLNSSLLNQIHISKTNSKKNQIKVIDSSNQDCNNAIAKSNTKNHNTSNLNSNKRSSVGKRKDVVMTNKKIIHSTNNVIHSKNEIMSPVSNKNMSINTLSQVLSPNNMANSVFSPNRVYNVSESNYSNLTNNNSKCQLDFKTEKISFDLLSPSNESNRMIFYNSNNKNKVYDTPQSNCSKNSKKSVLAEKVKFDAPKNSKKLMENLLNKAVFTKEDYEKNLKDDFQILGLNEIDVEKSTIKKKK